MTLKNHKSKQVLLASRRHWLATSLALALAAGCQTERPKFRSADITGGDWGGDFRLTDHTGKVRTPADFRGKVVLLFFGFTFCPDVCPTTLLKMSEAVKALGSAGEQVQVLFVTIDPERDTPELLRQYVPSFDPRFLGLTGTSAEIAETAKRFKAFYRKVDGKTPISYTMDHSTFAYAFDPQGRLRLLVPHNLTAVEIAEDLRQLLRG